MQVWSRCRKFGRLCGATRNSWPPRSWPRLNRDRFQPGSSTQALDGAGADSFRTQQSRRICDHAEIGHRALKDHRNTYASQLVTVGVQLGYVSHQLGRARVATTSNHYALVWWLGMSQGDHAKIGRATRRFTRKVGQAVVTSPNLRTRVDGT